MTKSYLVMLFGGRDRYTYAVNDVASIHEAVRKAADCHGGVIPYEEGKLSCTGHSVSTNLREWAAFINEEVNGGRASDYRDDAAPWCDDPEYIDTHDFFDEVIVCEVLEGGVTAPCSAQHPIADQLFGQPH